MLPPYNFVTGERYAQMSLGDTYTAIRTLQEKNAASEAVIESLRLESEALKVEYEATVKSLKRENEKLKVEIKQNLMTSQLVVKEKGNINHNHSSEST